MNSQGQPHRYAMDMGVVPLDRGHQIADFDILLDFLEPNWDNSWGQKEGFPKLGKSPQNGEISMELGEIQWEFCET